MCASTADIQSATAEIRRGKKKRQKEETTGQKYNGLPITMGGHNQTALLCGMPTIQYSARSAQLSVRLSKWSCPKMTRGQSNLTYLRCIAAVDGSMLFDT